MEEASSWMLLEDDTGRKRGRDNSAADSAFGLEGSQRTDVDYSSGRMSGTRTPRLELDEDRHQRPVKRFRGERSVIPVSPLAHRKRRGKKTLLHGVDDEDDSVQVAPACPLKLLPDDLLANCLSYLGGVEDRFALQSTSTQFRALSNSDPMRQYIPVGGDKQTGLHGIIQESDTPETAARSLEPYVKAGNLEAIYMYVVYFVASPPLSLRPFYGRPLCLFGLLLTDFLSPPSWKNETGLASSRAIVTRTSRLGSSC
jgi:hypothetical protein